MENKTIPFIPAIPATLAAITICLIACLIWAFNPLSILDIFIRPSKSECTPPKVFSEKDLIGIWQARSLQDTDTLYIRSDGKYQQIIHLESSQFNYESEWQNWHLSPTENGNLYLYLEGFNLCGVLQSSNCNKIGWGEAKWHDPCQDRWVSLPDEVILVVMGVSKRFVQPPKGIRLMLIISPEHGWGYELQDQ